jgi:hypothetical protein
LSAGGLRISEAAATVLAVGCAAASALVSSGLLLCIAIVLGVFVGVLELVSSITQKDRPQPGAGAISLGLVTFRESSVLGSRAAKPEMESR